MSGVDEAITQYNSSSSNANNGVIPLADRPRSGNYGREGRILELRLGAGPLAYGQPGRIEVTFRLERPVRQMAVGVGLDSMEGQRILTLDSDTSQRGFDLQPGVYTVSLGLEFWPLHPANYACSVALLVGHNFLDVLPPVGIWEVVTDKNDTVTDRGYGAARPKPLVELIAAAP
jgi:lipopolysaccharide transport system ATP-binding protein